MSLLIEDCLRIIFNILQDDPPSLYSCILVNKLWCQIGVQILWKNPFDTFNYRDYKTRIDKLCNIIIHWLPTQLFIDDNVILPSTQPSFNYISYSSQISPNFINYMINKLMNEEVRSEKYEKLEQEVYKLFVNNCKDIKDFRWVTAQPLYKYSGALTCFSQLNALSIDIQLVNAEALFGMAEICQNIQDLKLLHCNDDIPGLIRFIDIQKNLKSLDLSLKGVNQYKELSNAIGKKVATLKKLIVKSGVELLSPKFLPLLINLEYLKLKSRYCAIDDDDELMQEWKKYFSISSFPNLKHLKTTYLSTCNDYMLVEKSHRNILEISVWNRRDPIYTKKLFKAIAKNCPRIEKLKANFELENLSDIKEIFLNCSQLNRLFLSTNNDNELNCDELLEILINFSPKTFYEFSFSEEWNFSINGLQKFFENWKGRIPIKFNTRFDRSYFFTVEHEMIMKKYLDEGVIDKKTRHLW